MTCAEINSGKLNQLSNRVGHPGAPRWFWVTELLYVTYWMNKEEAGSLYLDHYLRYCNTYKKLTSHLVKTGWWPPPRVHSLIYLRSAGWFMEALAKEETSVSWYQPPNSHHWSLPGAPGSLQGPKCMFTAIRSISHGLSERGEIEKRKQPDEQDEKQFFHRSALTT